jgi:hypothetical protein
MTESALYPQMPPNVIDGYCRCTCGWTGKISNLVFLERVGNTKGCPTCHTEFIPAYLHALRGGDK